MNILEIPNGGMPFEGDDIRWLNDGILEAFKAMFFDFGQAHNGNFIISGCHTSFAAGFATITEGYVMLDWEVCYCPAQNVGVTSLAASSLKLVTSYDPAGTEVFADAVSRETYANRRAIASDGLNSGVEIPLDTTARYFHTENVNNFSSGWSAATGFTPRAERKGRAVFLSGAITGGDTNSIGFTLPAPFRPTERRIITTTLSSIQIFPTGAVAINSVLDDDTQSTVTGEYHLNVCYLI